MSPSRRFLWCRAACNTGKSMRSCCGRRGLSTSSRHSCSIRTGTGRRLHNQSDSWQHSPCGAGRTVLPRSCRLLTLAPTVSLQNLAAAVQASGGPCRRAADGAGVGSVCPQDDRAPAMRCSCCERRSEGDPEWLLLLAKRQLKHREPHNSARK